MSGHNKKVYIFVGVVAATAVMLWGVKGLVSFFPGPNPR